ncbi:superoxide dismutase [Patescibacteria group bacterium]|nr:superoxide dismutase [Patescibacteria group bacterium]MBU1705348.1 superoxide dismutase [Patescibacteria group bacterium]
MPSAKDYEAKPLPFDQDLEGISKKTLEIHHDKLYQGYVNKLKEVATKLSQSDSLFESANQTFSDLRGLRDGETFAANGVYLHEYYFQALGGDGVPQGPLADDLAAKWGSIEKFIAYFTASGLAARGWVVLCRDLQLERLKVYSCDAHNQGGVWGCLPILVLDVYEHAYFMDFGADRKAYINSFFKNLNWDRLNSLYEKAKSISLK